MPSEKHKIIPAVYCLLMKEGSVLLLRRFNTGYCDGQYSLPAGHLNGGETIMQAVIRETKEETGVDVQAVDLRLVHVMNRWKANDAERVDFFFATDKWTGTPHITEPDKCDDLKWVQLAELDGVGLIQYVRLLFENLQNGLLYSDTELT
ncbi:MAG: NUDIX domain-containing protein [Parcubacteria group bacterium]|nr:NUDIX domain-containing protein [Parcubacteria group bacterium]